MSLKKRNLKIVEKLFITDYDIKKMCIRGNDINRKDILENKLLGKRQKSIRQWNVCLFLRK